MITTRVAVLLERYQPGRSLSSIEASAGLPAASLTEWIDRTVVGGCLRRRCVGVPLLTVADRGAPTNAL